MLIRVLLLNVLCVRDRCLGKIGGFQFPGYFAPYIRGGTRAAVSRAGGGSCYGAISEGCQVKALNWLLRVVTTKTLDEEGKEKKQNS